MKVLFEESKEAKYYITREGEVWVYSLKINKWHQKKGTIHKRGYVYVRTPTKNYQLHRLVASAFIDNPENKPCVNHKDCNKQNNSVDNLEWVSNKENMQHAIKNGRMKYFSKNEGRVKYTNEQCQEILKRIKNGMTYAVAGQIYNMPYSTVAHLARGSRRLIYEN